MPVANISRIVTLQICSLLTQTMIAKGKSQFWISEEKVRSSMEATKLFFVLAMGRSGTTFLAQLLDKAADAYVVHEPVRSDFVAYPVAFHNAAAAKKYIHYYRRKEIYHRLCSRNVRIYGEVNGVLRRHAEALRQSFPRAVLVHLVRDGRDVVRSMISRKTFSWSDPTTLAIAPGKEDPWCESWEAMGRFERLCWYWQIENAYLRRIADSTVQFEQLISDFGYFSHLLRRLGMSVPEEAWRKGVKQPVNQTVQHALPGWAKWGKRYREDFERICGEEMQKNGYDLTEWKTVQSPALKERDRET